MLYQSNNLKVSPAFSYENDVFMIGFPTTTRIYYLYNDGSGNFSQPDGTNKENLTWIVG